MATPPPSSPARIAPARRARTEPVIALMPVALALGLQLALWSFINPFAWFLFFPAVFAASWLGGLWGGLRATLISTALVWWFFIPPEHALLGKAGKHYFAAAVFVGMGVTASLFQARLRQANAEITALYERTREVDALKTQFFANLSHELRTPLSLILGPVERLLADGVADAPARRQLEFIERNARLLLRHVEDLLKASKLEAGQVQLLYAPVDLAAMVRLVSSHYAGLAEERRITLTVQADGPVSIEGDADRLQLAVMNLLSNAMKFTPDGGTVRVALRGDRAAGRVALEVADSGPGVTPEHRVAIFERFHQLEGGMDRRFGGTGLGLSITRDIVVLHGGTVDVADAPEGGALFRVVLPARAPAGTHVMAAPVTPATPEAAAGPAAGTAGERGHLALSRGDAGADTPAGRRPVVLVVEDDRDMNTFVSGVLATDYRVASAFTAEEGIEQARRLHPDVVLTDVMMPGTSGAELLTAVRADPALDRVPVLVLSARADDRLRVQLLRDGAADYLTKPFSVEELRARVGNLVTAVRATAALQEREALAIELAAAHRMTQTRLEGLLDAAPDAMVVVDPDGRIRLVNRQTEVLLGYDRGELLGEPVELLIPVDRAAAHPTWRTRFFADPRSRPMGADLDLAARRKDGSTVPIDVALSPFRTDEGMFVTAALRDITERRALEDRLRVHADRFRATFEDAPIGMALTDLRPPRAGAWTAVNAALCQTLGYSEAELLAADPGELVHPAHRDDGALGPLIAGELEHLETERRYRHHNGRFVWIRLSMSVVHGADGTPEFAVTHLEDITARREEEKLLAYAALHDGLTGLANRTLLMDRLGQLLAELGRSAGLLTVFFVDLDRFKHINDTHGHAAGDRVLIEVGQRLGSLIRPTDTAARIAGDEFVVVCRELPSEREVLQLAERVLAVLDRPVTLDGQAIELSASIGIAIAGPGAREPDELLRAADLALYQAKSSGRRRFALYDEALASLSSRRDQIESDLRDALANDRFVLHYQPVVRLADEEIVGVEALLRLDHPTRGLLAPDEFLDTAEATGLIIPIGTWVIQEACRQQARWAAQLTRPLTMAVNVSARQFAHGDVEETVTTALAAAGVDPHRLCLEITESVFADSTGTVTSALSGLRAKGVRLAIDDFGTGYSSLAYLKRFAVDTIKIDRGFTAGLGVHHDDTAIIDAIAALGRSLSLTVVAEGVETAQQRDALRELGCALAQGHLYAAAGDAATIGPVLARGTLRPQAARVDA